MDLLIIAEESPQSLYTAIKAVVEERSVEASSHKLPLSEPPPPPEEEGSVCVCVCLLCVFVNYIILY